MVGCAFAAEDDIKKPEIKKEKRGLYLGDAGLAYAPTLTYAASYPLSTAEVVSSHTTHHVIPKKTITYHRQIEVPTPVVQPIAVEHPVPYPIYRNIPYKVEQPIALPYIKKTFTSLPAITNYHAEYLPTTYLNADHYPLPVQTYAKTLPLTHTYLDTALPLETYPTITKKIIL